MIPVVPCSPSEASRRAAWFRKYARAEGATAEQVAEREATAAAYQDMAVCGGIETGKNADGAVDW